MIPCSIFSLQSLHEHLSLSLSSAGEKDLPGLVNEGRRKSDSVCTLFAVVAGCYQAFCFMDSFRSGEDGRCMAISPHPEKDQIKQRLFFSKVTLQNSFVLIRRFARFHFSFHTMILPFRSRNLLYQLFQGHSCFTT